MKNISVVGIDILNKGLILSYVTSDREEPKTISEENREASVVFSLCLCKEKNVGKFYAADEAKAYAMENDVELIDNIYQRALHREKAIIEGREYDCRELFATYLRKIIDETGFFTQDLDKLVVTIPTVDEEAIELFTGISKHMSIDKGVFMLIDHYESYIYFTMAQNPSIYAKDVCLFEYDKEQILTCILSKDMDVRPVDISLTMEKENIDDTKRSESFREIAEKTFEKHNVSAVFLSGDGFNLEWLEDIFPFLCDNKRVFMGDNLYSKGAVNAGVHKLVPKGLPFKYNGDHEMKMSLLLKVSGGNDMSFVTLVRSGENWYTESGECEVILDGNAQFECWIQNPANRSSRIQMIELNKMPKRKNRTTRLRINATPVSDKTVTLTVTDLGFGDIAPSSGHVWIHRIDMGE